MSNCLLIDIGSTSIKWAVYDRELRAKSDVSKLVFPRPIMNRSPLYEVDAEDIVQPIMAVVDRCEPAMDRLYLSTQMHGYLLEASDGELLTPYISWKDRRSALLGKGGGGPEPFPVRLPPESGSSVKPNSPLCGLYAMSRLDPERFSLARRFYTLGSYVAYRLAGANATHITDAAASGMYNKEDGTSPYNPYPALEVPEATMELRPIGSRGRLAVYSPIGDHQASVLGSGLRHEREYLLNLGTAAQLCVVAEGHAAGEFESRPYFGGKTLCTVSGLLGGREIATRSGMSGMTGKSGMTGVSGMSDFADELARNYESAMSKLPARERLLAIGGASGHHQELVVAVCDRLGLPYTLRPDRDALDGLIESIEKEAAT